MLENNVSLDNVYKEAFEGLVRDGNAYNLNLLTLKSYFRHENQKIISEILEFLQK